MPRPELRNHGVGWMRAVERLRNGGEPPNSVFLMPATHCRNPTDVMAVQGEFPRARGAGVPKGTILCLGRVLDAR